MANSITAPVVAAAVGLALLSQPGWREETIEGGEVTQVKPLPRKSIIVPCVALSILCLMLHIAAATWQQVAAMGEQSATEYAFQGNVQVTVGSTATVFVWLSTGAFLLASFMVQLILTSLLNFLSLPTQSTAEP